MGSVLAKYIMSCIPNTHSLTQVYALNESLLIIDQFTFDGQGAGVFINVATEGNNRGQWIANKKIVDYPSSLDARPIERPYLSERLFIQVRSGK